MRSGVYKIYGLEHAGDQVGKKTYYGRLAVVNGHTQVLEDTKDNFLSRAFPDGLVDDQKARRWHGLVSDPYVLVITEGLIDEAGDDMEQPDVNSEEVFDVVDHNGARQVLEAYGENLFLDGKKLDGRQIEEFQRRVRVGELHLLPREPQQ